MLRDKDEMATELIKVQRNLENLGTVGTSVGYPRQTACLGFLPAIYFNNQTTPSTPSYDRGLLLMSVLRNTNARPSTHRSTCALCRAKQSDGGAEVSALACGILAMAFNIDSSSAKSAGVYLVLRVCLKNWNNSSSYCAHAER